MEERERWWKMGLKAISEGKLAVLLLSGGQVWDLSPIFLLYMLKIYCIQYLMMWVFALLPLDLYFMSHLEKFNT